VILILVEGFVWCVIFGLWCFIGRFLVVMMMMSDWVHVCYDDFGGNLIMFQHLERRK